MSEITVDVAIPAYKRATFIAEAIESVLLQTHDRWKLTVSDNGTGGGEVEQAVQPYLSDPRISHVVTGSELPLAENWTRAVKQGSSPYVALLNDDDRWHPDFLGARVEALEANPECGFAFGEWVQIDDAGTAIDGASSRYEEGVLDRPLLAAWFTRENPVAPSATMVRRSALDAVGSSFDGAWQYCDWEMWARLAARFPAYYLARLDSDFRRHAQAYSYASGEDPDRLLRMLDHIEQLFDEVEGFRRSRIERAKTRSLVLLHSAIAIHQGGGWPASGALYRRAIREYPPSVLGSRSRSMLARSLLGERGSKAVRGALRRARLRR